MVLYPSTNILLSKLDEDEKVRDSLHSVENYLEINGDSYSQTWNSSDRPSRTEYHYFMGDAVVRIMKFNKRADIKIIAATEKRSDDLKKSIEDILNKK
jgi:hypothetical protein